MAQANLSVLGLYNYDGTIFEKMLLPVDIDSENAINSILLECANLSVVYTDPNFLKFAIGEWSRREINIWEKLVSTTKYEYNPIHNYDRTEEITELENKENKTSVSGTTLNSSNDSKNHNINITDNHTRNLTETDNSKIDKIIQDKEIANRNISDKETRDLDNNTIHNSETSGDTVNSGMDTTTDKVHAFNSSTPTPTQIKELKLDTKNKSTGTIDYTTSVTDSGIIEKISDDKNTINKDVKDNETRDITKKDTGTILNTGVNQGNETLISNSDIIENKENNEEGYIERNHSMRAFGNIGVTTTQQMIQAEREVVLFNIINHIVDSFKYNFCIMVY